MYGSDVSPAQSAAHQQARISRAHERRVGSRRPVPPAEEGAQAPHRTPAVQTPESLTGERFPRRVRLARGPELAACWEQGRRLRTPHLDLAWRPSPLDHPRMAIVVPRFQFTAVARNRLRRRLKEILRRYPVASLPIVDLVVRAKHTAYAAHDEIDDGERGDGVARSEEHTSELQSQSNLVCRLLLEKKKKTDD